MRNPRLASRYAKSIMDLAVERGQIDDVNKSILAFHKAIRESRDLQLLFKSPVIKSDSKEKIVKSISTKIGTDTLTEAFVNLIIAKKREFFLPEIFDAFVELYKEKNNIVTVKLSVAHDISDAMRSSLEQHIKTQLPEKSIDLVVEVKEKLIGGFLLESNNKLFDASIARDLKDIKDQFLKNIYVPNIR